MTHEEQRLEASRRHEERWNRWGPYLSERAWGTVREDYSANGAAWEYFPHDYARSQAYRWNEDGIAGICDRHQKICFAVALWNERDPILKERLFGLTGNDYIVNGTPGVVNPSQTGTKACAHYKLDIAVGGCATVKLRLSDTVATGGVGGTEFDEILADRQRQADEFYSSVIPSALSNDAQNVMRQAFAGLLWSKQFYHYVVNEWLEGDPAGPPPPEGHKQRRNHDWPNLYNADVISMPDKWEYPWYASRDLAFHCVALALVDPDFGTPVEVANSRINES
jgi:hypothetical protein